MVHLPPISLQGMGHPTIARAGKVQDDFLSRITHRHFFGPLGWLNQDVVFAIVPGAIDEAPARRDGEWKGAASPGMRDRLPHVAGSCGSLPNASDNISPFPENSYTHNSLLRGCC